MKLSEYIKKYRASQGISQRHFARIAGISNSTVSLIESGINPQTGLPAVFHIETYNAIAKALNMSVQELFDQIDDVPLDLSFKKETNDLNSISPQESALILYYRSMSPEGRTLLLRSAEAFSAAYPAASEKKLG